MTYWILFAVFWALFAVYKTIPDSAEMTQLVFLIAMSITYLASLYVGWMWLNAAL